MYPGPESRGTCIYRYLLHSCDFPICGLVSGKCKLVGNHTGGTSLLSRFYHPRSPPDPHLCCPAGSHALQPEPIFFPPFVDSQLASSLRMSYSPAPWAHDPASRKQNYRNTSRRVHRYVMYARDFTGAIHCWERLKQPSCPSVRELVKKTM